MPTKIQWCDESWNPIIGCSKVSAGCENCYAEKMALRLANMGNTNYDEVVSISVAYVYQGKLRGKWNGKTNFVESAVKKPLHWRKSRRIFVCSMGDLFHESVPFTWIGRVFSMMRACPQHTFIVLTKRAKIMQRYMIVAALYSKHNPPPPNVILGVSVEDQATADERIPILLRTPAARRLISLEPLLEDVYVKPEYIKNIDWIIIGAESGANRRPCNPEWLWAMTRYYESEGVPVFIKQVDFQGNEGKLVKMPEIDGRVWAQYPEGVSHGLV